MMTRWLQGRRRDERGTSLVEFALVFPLFALLLFSLIDFGLAFGGLISLRNAVAAAARSAAVGYVTPSCTTASNPMLCTAQTDIGTLTGTVPGSIEVAVEFPNGGGTPGTVGQPVRVCAEAALRSSTGLTAPFLAGHTIQAAGEARIEQPPTYGAGSAPAGFSC